MRPFRPPFALAAATLLLGVAQVAPASPPAPSPTPPASTPADVDLPSFELRRDDRVILVQQTAQDDEGGVSIIRGGDCREGADLSFYYAPAPKLIETTVNDTQITSRVVLREQPRPENTEGDAEAQDEAVLEFFGGSLSLNPDTVCPDNVVRNAAQRVTLREGRTTVEGGPFLYDNASGVGEMQGPVELVRREAGDSPALTASSSGLSLNVDDDLQILRGNVQVESDGRVSEAEVLELDEDAGFAILRGNPARSRDGDGEVAGEVIEYDLDSNDVVVRGSVRATFNLDEVGGVGDGVGGDAGDAAALPDEDEVGGDGEEEGGETPP